MLKRRRRLTQNSKIRTIFVCWSTGNTYIISPHANTRRRIAGREPGILTVTLTSGDLFALLSQTVSGSRRKLKPKGETGTSGSNNDSQDNMTTLISEYDVVDDGSKWRICRDIELRDITWRMSMGYEKGENQRVQAGKTMDRVIRMRGGSGCVIRHLTSRSSWLCVWVCACWVLSGGMVVVVVPVDVVVDDRFDEDEIGAVGCGDGTRPADAGGRVKVG